MVKIVPKSKSKADIFGDAKFYYIIRPDLGYYMKSTDLHRGKETEVYEIFKLHPSCMDGDHYLATHDNKYYIIKLSSNSYRRVSCLKTDEYAEVYSLHPNCRGGDHYSSSQEFYYIFFQKRGIFHKTKNLNTDQDGCDYPLHPDCRNGLYYFGTKAYNFFVNKDTEWGVRFTANDNFKTNGNPSIWSIHPDALSFLPGGLSIVKGPSFGTWTCIKTIRNGSQTPIQWSEGVTKKIGYEKEKMSSIEHSWKVSSQVSIGTEGLLKLISQAQLSLSAEYGGSSTNTKKENWSDATEVVEKISLTLEPQKEIYIYVYQMGFGNEPLLHCKAMRILSSPIPPTDNPLPPAVN